MRVSKWFPKWLIRSVNLIDCHSTPFCGFLWDSDMTPLCLCASNGITSFLTFFWEWILNSDWITCWLTCVYIESWLNLGWILFQGLRKYLILPKELICRNTSYNSPWRSECLNRESIISSWYWVFWYYFLLCHKVQQEQ